MHKKRVDTPPSSLKNFYDELFLNDHLLFQKLIVHHKFYKI